MRQGIMLCYPYEEKRFNKWGKKAFLQPKLDGDRCRAIFDEEGRVTLLSSEENIIGSVPHINKELESLQFKNIELDGELYLHGMPHEDIHSIVSRKVRLHYGFQEIEYHVFDIVDSSKQVDRFNLLDKLLVGLHKVRGVPTHLVSSEDDIAKELAFYMERGYEGIILRNLDAPYKRARSTSIMKCKPRRSDTYKIVMAIEEEDIKGNPKNALGALVLTSDEGTHFNVGTGFTREQRETLWESIMTIPGFVSDKYAEIKYQEITSARGVPRFPVFIKIKETN